MINILQNWWYCHQIETALKQNNQHQAQKLLGKLEKSKSNLPIIAQLYRKQLNLEKTVQLQHQEIAELTRKISKKSHFLEIDLPFIQFVKNSFRLLENEPSVLQCQGIDEQVFNPLEESLTEFIQEEFEKIKKSSSQKFNKELDLALQDINGLKKGIDPSYHYLLSPHIYLLQYFLENIYCNYLAWFLIYKSGLLAQKINILDIAAGPSTVIYGLALLLQSYQQFSPLPQIHLSYYSLEKESSLQYRGLQFWRKYIESPHNLINAYFRFDTVDLLEPSHYLEKLPKQFFNFIFISHCFFYESQLRKEAHSIYQQVFKQHLSDDGYVVLIIQGCKLYRLYNGHINEDVEQEKKIIQKFLDELKLELVWYQFLTSTGQRVPLRENFGQFAKDNLPKQISLSSLKKEYLKEKWISHYSIDDYVILAKPQ